MTSTRTTRTGWLVLGAAAVAVVLGRVLGLAELHVLGGAALGTVVVAHVWVRVARADLDVTRALHPRHVHVGGRSRLELTVVNRGRRRSPVLAVHDAVPGTVGANVAVPPLAPGGVLRAGYRLPTERRGLVPVGPLETVLTDPFGLVRRRRVVTGVTPLTVLPAIDALHGATSRGGIDDPLAGLAHAVLGGTGDEDFATLRPYVVGDDLRRVHWASTARAGELLVRQDDPPWQGNLTVLLDARERRTDPDRFEVAVSAAASLVQAVVLRGDRLRLVLTDGTDTGLVDARTARDALLEHLAVVRLHDGDALPDVAGDRRTRSGGLVVVTGTPGREDLARIARQRARFTQVHLVTVDPTAVRPRAGRDVPVAAPSVDVVRVDADTAFPAAWAADPTAARR